MLTWFAIADYSWRSTTRALPTLFDVLCETNGGCWEMDVAISATSVAGDRGRADPPVVFAISSEQASSAKSIGVRGMWIILYLASRQSLESNPLSLLPSPPAQVR